MAEWTSAPEESSTELNLDSGASPRHNRTLPLPSPFLSPRHSHGPMGQWAPLSNPVPTEVPPRRCNTAGRLPAHTPQRKGPSGKAAHPLGWSEVISAQHGAATWRRSLSSPHTQPAAAPSAHACRAGRRKRRPRAGGSVAGRRKLAGGVGAIMSASLLRRGLELLEAPGEVRGGAGAGRGWFPADGRDSLRSSCRLAGLQRERDGPGAAGAARRRKRAAGPGGNKATVKGRVVKSAIGESRAASEREGEGALSPSAAFAPGPLVSRSQPPPRPYPSLSIPLDALLVSPA